MNKLKVFRKYRIFVILALALVLLSASGTWAFAQTALAGDGTISACVTKDGSLYINNTATCRRSETLLSWNMAGPQGPQGPQGEPGPAGPAGPAGAAGEPGPAGATGPTGPQGEVGPAGPAGPAGATGPQGPMGATGPAGAQGPQGLQGEPGPQGLNGETGASAYDLAVKYGFSGPVTDWLASLVGPQGPKGDQGERGLQGLQGQVGPVGPQGLQGDRGPAGPQGLQGEVGPAGAAGPQGIPGPQGPQGEPGQGVTVLDSLQGIACNQGSPNAGVLEVSYDATGAVSLRCVPATTFPLTVTISGDGHGNITSMPAGIACGDTCSAEYTLGTQVTLTAVPIDVSDDLYTEFLGWSGACSGTGDCVVTMDQAKSVTATFRHYVMVYPSVRNHAEIFEDGGMGGVGLAPRGSCIFDSYGSTSHCENNFYYTGETVTLTAYPLAGATFEVWQSSLGICSGTNPQCQFTITDAMPQSIGVLAWFLP